MKTREEGEVFFKNARGIFQKTGSELGNWITNSAGLQIYFKEKEKFGKETEIGDDVFYLEF